MQIEFSLLLLLWVLLSCRGSGLGRQGVSVGRLPRGSDFLYFFDCLACHLSFCVFLLLVLFFSMAGAKFLNFLA